MRGKDEQQLDVFSYISPEQRVPQDHPLRPLRVMSDEALREMQPRFNKLYAKTGRHRSRQRSCCERSCRNLKVTPHVAQNLQRPGGSAIDARTTHHAGYAISQRKRKCVWSRPRPSHPCSSPRTKVGWIFTFTVAAYNLVRMRNLATQST
jgi:hypothetical protein